MTATPTVLATGSNAGASPSCIATLTAAPASATGLVLAVVSVNANDFGQVTDSRGNTWTQVASETGAFPRQYLWKTTQDVHALQVGDTVTAGTTTGHGVGTSLMAIVDGSGLSSTLDKSSSQIVASGTSRAAGTTATTTQASEIILGQFGVHTGTSEASFSPSAGYTSLLAGGFYAGGGSNALEIVYQLVGATGAFSPSGTGGTSGNSVGLATTFQANFPINTVAPTVSGSTPQGSTLTCGNGTFTNTPSSYTYQWTQDGVDIGGATSSTYVTQLGDVGHAIGCKIVATNASGNSQQIASSNTITVTAAAGGAGRELPLIGVG